MRRSAARVASLIKEAAPKTKLISEFPALRVPLRPPSSHIFLVSAYATTQPD